MEEKCRFDPPTTRAQSLEAFECQIGIWTDAIPKGSELIEVGLAGIRAEGRGW
jgi:hypothetical protein